MSNIIHKKFLASFLACLSGSLLICLSADAQNPSSSAKQNLTHLSTLTKTFSSQPFLLAQSQTQRVALVIGNSNYKNGSNLRNPVNDANDMAKVLKDLNFEVILLTNANLRSMDQGLERFYQKLQSGAVGLFYYAGHGVQVNGENYLVPVDADLVRESEVTYEAVPLGKLLGAIRDIENDVNIIILDACRDNPFARSWTRSSRRGLAPVQNSATGSFIAYATGPGNTAQDGTGRNGTFTEALLKHLKNENQNIEEIFKRVRVDVAKKTNSEQVPWTTSSLIGDFYFSQTKIADSITDTIATNTTTTTQNTNQPIETRTNNQEISPSNQNKLPTQTPVVDPQNDLVAANTTSSPTNNSNTVSVNNNQDSPEVTSLETKQDLVSRLNDMTSDLDSRIEKMTQEMGTPDNNNTLTTDQAYNPSRTFFAGSPPKLVDFRTPHNTTSYPSPTYYVTIKMPSNSTSSLSKVSIEQKENVDTIDFHLDKTQAFITDENNDKVTIPVTVTRSPSSADIIDIVFGTPVKANSTVTIKFKGKRHPSFDGIFQFKVEVFPEGVNPVGLNLGTSRIHLYKTF